MIKLKLKFGLVFDDKNKEVREIIEQIIKECFWDYNFETNDIVKIVKSGSFNEKMFLFQKILSNSSDVLRALRIFSERDLKELFNKYKVSQFNRDYLQKRRDVVESVLFNKEIHINGLDWKNE